MKAFEIATARVTMMFQPRKVIHSSSVEEATHDVKYGSDGFLIYLDPAQACGA